jgi:RNA polymerase sigma-70 factor (ECF subfamily)
MECFGGLVALIGSAFESEVGGIASEAEVEMVFRSHAGQVWRALLVMSAGRREIADEATAEAFVRLFDHREAVRDPVPWVFRTAFRLCAAELRRERVLDPQHAAHAAADLSRPGVLPSALTDALRELSPDQRVAVFLRYYADLSVLEVARLSGSTPATVGVRLHRARRALRVALEEEGRYA